MQDVYNEFQYYQKVKKRTIKKRKIKVIEKKLEVYLEIEKREEEIEEEGEEEEEEEEEGEDFLVITIIENKMKI